MVKNRLGRGQAGTLVVDLLALWIAGADPHDVVWLDASEVAPGRSDGESSLEAHAHVAAVRWSHTVVTEPLALLAEERVEFGALPYQCVIATQRVELDPDITRQRAPSSVFHYLLPGRDRLLAASPRRMLLPRFTGHRCIAEIER
jgi:hypothetical protein